MEYVAVAFPGNGISPAAERGDSAINQCSLPDDARQDVAEYGSAWQCMGRHRTALQCMAVHAGHLYVLKDVSHGDALVPCNATHCSADPIHCHVFAMLAFNGMHHQCTAMHCRACHTAVHGSAWQCGSTWNCMTAHRSAWHCVATHVGCIAVHGSGWKCMMVLPCTAM